jgi:hypothetical protein
MRFIFLRTHLLELISMAMPFIAAAGTYLCLHFLDRAFWTSVYSNHDEMNDMAGAMMAVTEVVLWLMSVAVGCIGGFVLALYAKLRHRKMTPLIAAAFCINGVPLVLIMFFFLKSSIYGI